MRKFTQVWVAVLGLLLFACSSKPPNLEGAIHPDLIPVYPGATLDPNQGIGGATTSGDYGDFYAVYWDLKTSDGPDKVLAFYKKAWPAAKERKSDSGSTELTWETFPGAEKGESISVSIEPGQIHLSEDLKLGKHKKQGL